MQRDPVIMTVSATYVAARENELTVSFGTLVGVIDETADDEDDTDMVWVRRIDGPDINNRTEGYIPRACVEVLCVFATCKIFDYYFPDG